MRWILFCLEICDLIPTWFNFFYTWISFHVKFCLKFNLIWDGSFIRYKICLWKSPKFLLLIWISLWDEFFLIWNFCVKFRLKFFKPKNDIVSRQHKTLKPFFFSDFLAITCLPPLPPISQVDHHSLPSGDLRHRPFTILWVSIN